MQVTLRVKNGPLSGRIIFLKAGQRAEVGRTEWADFTFPQDPQMADVHFAVECLADACLIHDLNTASGTLVNGEAIQEARLSHGMEILAGETRFQVVIEPTGGSAEPGREHDSFGNTAPMAGPPGEAAGPLAADYCQVLELEEASQAILAENPRLSPERFLDLLIERELLVDAIRFKAQTMPKRQAIWWTLQCVRMFPEDSPKQALNEQAIATVEHWLADPAEEHRRGAESAARALNYETPAAWAAMTVFWSEGSLAPPETEVVPPADHLTGVATSAALLMAAATGPAVDVSTRHRQFLEIADQPAPER